MNNESTIFRGREVLLKEAAAVEECAGLLGDDFIKLCERVSVSSGKLIVSGVGKAGIIGIKIVATFASIGVTAVWMDPLNAFHGDLGVAAEGDIALMLSNSGTTTEILELAGALHSLGVWTCALTSTRDSALSRLCDSTVAYGAYEEACPWNMAPSVSTTVMLALGDAVALTVLEMRNVADQDFARFHPAGALGRRLRPVTDFLRIGDSCAVVRVGASILEALEAITRARTGLCVVVDNTEHLVGVYTDGDFRRDALAGRSPAEHVVDHSMTVPGKFVHDDLLAGEAVESMRDYHTNIMPVVSKDMKLVGIVDVQDLL